METLNAVRFLSALAQETRLSIFRMLVEAGATGLAAGEIAAAVGVSPANLSFHLKELAHADLVRSRHDGRYVFYSANFANMNDLLAFLTDNCCARDGCGPCSTDKPKKSTKGVRP
jgi:ArsR family transcriptional regulator, arsenate/arsenite/antimonite-responsive transcriptional repressor